MPGRILPAGHDGGRCLPKSCSWQAMICPVAGSQVAHAGEEPTLRSDGTQTETPMSLSSQSGRKTHEELESAMKRSDQFTRVTSSEIRDLFPSSVGGDLAPRPARARRCCESNGMSQYRIYLWQQTASGSFLIQNHLKYENRL